MGCIMLYSRSFYVSRNWIYIYFFPLVVTAVFGIANPRSLGWRVAFDCA
jgi:hypothetical protein